MENPHASAPVRGTVRGTQLLVEHMGEVFKRPSLTAIEIGWRWLFGIPFFLVCWEQAQRILAAYPLASSGYDSIASQNPWLAVVQLVDVWSYYLPHMVAVLRWLLPVAAVVWAVVSGVGRNLLFMRLGRGIGKRPRFRPLAMVALQAAWIALLALTCWGWFRAVQWAAATHISVGGEPDLVGYFIWLIVLSLGFFTAWALASWALSIAPLLMLFEERSALSALGQSVRLGKTFTGMLAEINLTMGVVTMALIVLTMVLSTAPLPFANQLGSGAAHLAMAIASIFYCVASDYFQVVRLKAFVEFWRICREQPAATPAS
jgi:hypothetical protein